jgi:hypothetical protein
MNGSELRFLAERATALEDRTTVRLAEVHDRVAAARRRRRIAALTGVAGVAFLVAIPAAAVNASHDSNAPQPAPAPAPGSSTAPERGTCWAVAPETMDDLDFWYDDSPQVPCTEEHTTETVVTFTVADPTPDTAREYQDRCSFAVRGYLGVSDSTWIPWVSGVFLPSHEQIADGARWMRCDAGFPDTWSYGAPRTTTASAEAIADDPPAELWACLNQAPSVTDQPFVPCDRPHTYEQTGTSPVIVGAQEYPTKAELDSEALAQCAPAVPDTLAGASVVARWDTRSEFEPYRSIGGVCFMFNADGTPLPAR